VNKVLVLLLLGAFLAVLKAVLIALVAALLLVLAYSFVSRPAETLAFLAALTIFGLASAQPVAFIITLGVVGVAVVVAGAWQKARSQRPPMDSRRKHLT
jgi:chromate transport protein ChrA